MIISPVLTAISVVQVAVVEALYEHPVIAGIAIKGLTKGSPAGVETVLKGASLSDAQFALALINRL